MVELPGITPGLRITESLDKSLLPDASFPLNITSKCLEIVPSGSSSRRGHISSSIRGVNAYCKHLFLTPAYVTKIQHLEYSRAFEDG